MWNSVFISSQTYSLNNMFLILTAQHKPALVQFLNNIMQSRKQKPIVAVTLQNTLDQNTGGTKTNTQI